MSESCCFMVSITQHSNLVYPVAGRYRGTFGWEDILFSFTWDLWLLANCKVYVSGVWKTYCAAANIWYDCILKGWTDSIRCNYCCNWHIVEYPKECCIVYDVLQYQFKVWITECSSSRDFIPKIYHFRKLQSSNRLVYPKSHDC